MRARSFGLLLIGAAAAAIATGACDSVNTAAPGSPTNTPTPGGSNTATPTPTSGAPGNFRMKANCSPPGCGKTGTLVGQLLDSGSGAVVAHGSHLGVTFTMGVATTADMMAPSNLYFLHAWLDVNTNGVLDSGDVISPIGDFQVFVSPGTTTEQTVFLSNIKP